MNAMHTAQERRDERFQAAALPRTSSVRAGLPVGAFPPVHRETNRNDVLAHVPVSSQDEHTQAMTSP